LAISIVEDFDVIEDIGSGQIAGLVDALSDPFLLQAAGKLFGHGIGPAAAAPTHARLQVVSGAESPPVVAAVLRVLIRMHQHALLGFASPHGHRVAVPCSLGMP
jgi:hypothetical protein